MNKFLLKVYVLLCGGVLVTPSFLFPAVGFFSQTIDFDYELVEENIFYHDGTLNNELDKSTISNKHSEYGVNYHIKFKSGYHHKFFAVMLEYVLAIETEERYNQIDVNIKKLNQKIKGHQITPSVFFQWKPFRLGMGYHFNIASQSIANKQRSSIRPKDSLSFYLHVFFPELWYQAPIGLGVYYEIAFNPQLPSQEIRSHLFQSAGISFNINFNYLSQFQIMFTYQRLDEKVTLFKVRNDYQYYAVDKKYLVRYYVDYSFTHQILKELALRVGIGNLVYSDFESPVLSLSAGFTYSFLRI